MADASISRPRFSVTPLATPDMLSADEMRYIAEQGVSIWGGYAHQSADELRLDIERRPNALYVARAATAEIAGFLETYNLVTGGDPEKIPASAEDVRRQVAVENHDTRLLFRLEAYVTGAAIPLISSAKEFPESNIFTYSPLRAASMHRRFGAKPVRVIPDGRKDFKDSHVAVMCYRSEHTLEALTEQQIDEIIRSNSTALVF